MFTDNQRCVVFGLVQLVVGLNLPVPVALFDLPFRPLLVGTGNCLTHLIQRHSIVFQQTGLQLDPHSGQRGTTHLHIANALHLQQFLPDYRLGQVIQLTTAQYIAGQRQHHDRRLSRVDLAISRHAAHTAGQQFTSGIDRSLYFTRCSVNIPVQIKLHHHPGTALKAAAGHLCDAGNATQRPFQRCSYRGRHHLRTGTGQAGLHSNHRKIHVRQGRNREQAKTKNTRQYNRHTQQHGRHRATNKGRGQVHAV